MQIKNHPSSHDSKLDSKLDLLPSSMVENSPNQDTILGLIHRVWSWVFDIFGTEPALKFWKTTDSQNSPQWHIYDPRTNVMQSFDSEYEAIAWLETVLGVDHPFDRL